MSDVQGTEPTEPFSPPPLSNLDDEEFGDFVCAFTDPFKQPIYSSHPPDEDETLQLLNTNSNPEWQSPFALASTLQRVVCGVLGNWR
jgi:hypothetical protein